MAPSRIVDFEIFDADNHMYETEDALTKFAVKGQISESPPTPPFDVVARPGAQEEYFRHGNPEGKSYRELVGEPMGAIPAFRQPRAPVALIDEMGGERSPIV